MIETKTIHERLSKHILADGLEMVMDIENSHGSYIKNTKGEEYLDMFSMFASASVGYNHPYLVQHADFLGKMAINKPSMSDVYNEYYADFLDTFSRVAIPNELQYCFFISGGALAVENALKTAFDWKTRLNHSQGIKHDASKVIHFKEAFHGRTGYTLSLTNTKDPRKYMYFPMFDWPRIINPKMNFPITDDSLNQTKSKENLAIEQIEIALNNNPNQIACVIIETIQGEGGDNYFREEFLQKLRSICDEHEILLIFDEVQTGLAMTGKMWAYQHYNVLPDIIAFGKKTQVCGILANQEKLDLVPNHVFKESSRINSTFGGNFIDMMRLKLILEIIEKENLTENAKLMGDYLKSELEKVAHEYNHLISNVRGLGLWVAFDLKSEQERKDFIKKAYQNKLLLLPCGEKSIRFRPHLTVNQEEIDKAVKIVRNVLAAKNQSTTTS